MFQSTIALLSIATILVACSGNSGDDASDANTSADSGGEVVFDAAVFDAAALPDAVPAPDAAPTFDAGQVTDELCIEACMILISCFGKATPGDTTECEQECTTDLLDCSAAQREEVSTCLDTPPGDDCEDLIGCFEAIACIDA